MPKHRPASRNPAQGIVRRFVRLHPKLISATIFGIVVAAFLPFDVRMPTRLLSGWDAGVALYLVLIHAMLGRWDISHIRSRAAEQDEGAAAILLLSIGATLASLVAIVFALGGSTQASDGQAVLLVLFAAATILLSWGFVHTIFALHYAHEYYGLHADSMIGGLKFPDDKEPNYLDFVYFSLVIGMTSQVSDVAVTSKHIRRVVTMHGVLSFFFNLVVLALTVNMLSNLVK